MSQTTGILRIPLLGRALRPREGYGGYELCFDPERAVYVQSIAAEGGVRVGNLGEGGVQVVFCSRENRVWAEHCGRERGTGWQPGGGGGTSCVLLPREPGMGRALWPREGYGRVASTATDRELRLLFHSQKSRIERQGCCSFANDPENPLYMVIRIVTGGADRGSFDPAKIPDLDAGISEEGRAAVKNAFIALQAMTWFMVGDGLPHPLAFEFWRQMWKWIEFIWMYPSLVLEVLEGDTGTYAYGPRYLAGAACVCFAHVPSIATLVASTPGYWMLVSEHWGNTLLRLRDESTEDLFIRVCETVDRLNCGFTNAENFQSMTDGAGGTLNDLASLIAQHMGMITQGLRLPVPETACQLFVSGLWFLSNVSEFDPRIAEALLPHDIVVHFLEAYHSIAAPPPSVQQGLFDALTPLLDTPPGYPWIIQALKSGLLRAVLRNGQTAAGVDHTKLKQLLQTTLPSSTVYYSVLSQLQISLAEAGLNKMAQTLVPGVRTQYSKFLRVALEHLAIKKEYDSPQQCQAEDWKTEDGHRVLCGRLASGTKLYIETDGALTTTAGGHNLSKRDASFLRAVVHHDYNNVWKEMRTRQMLQRTRTLILTYVKAGMDGRVGVNAGMDPSNTRQFQRLAWPHEVDWQARLKRGGGRVNLHLVFVSEGRATRIHLIPLRSSNGMISHGLDQLRRRIPVGTNMAQLLDRFPQIVDELEDLLDTKPVEIH
ncbi:hypothetical protein DFH06DRAFT_1370966 [Mycena polygramma]|nr:hypothetical protein DFH06DRAFT_1370966 [Mycena polygramma]